MVWLLLLDVSTRVDSCTERVVGLGGGEGGSFGAVRRVMESRVRLYAPRMQRDRVGLHPLDGHHGRSVRACPGLRRLPVWGGLLASFGWKRGGGGGEGFKGEAEADVVRECAR